MHARTNACMHAPHLHTQHTHAYWHMHRLHTLSHIHTRPSLTFFSPFPSSPTPSLSLFPDSGHSSLKVPLGMSTQDSCDRSAIILPSPPTRESPQPHVDLQIVFPTLHFHIISSPHVLFLPSCPCSLVVPPEIGYPGNDFNKVGPRPLTFSVSCCSAAAPFFLSSAEDW